MLSRRLVAAALVASPLGAQQLSRAALVQKIDSIAAAPVKSGAVAGMAVAVVKGRDTLLMKGYGFADLENQVPATPQTVFRIGSITKQFTSSAVMQLVQEGKIGLDDDITKYLPNIPTHGRHVSIRNLLNHTSGIPSYTDVGPVFGRVMRLDLTHDSLLAVIAHDSLMFEPGSHVYYNNTGYYILGMLLEKVTGKPYGEYLEEHLFKPNGLTSTVYCDTKRLIPHRAQGYDRSRGAGEGRGGSFTNTDFISMDLPFAAGSLCSTVGDLVEWTRRLSSGRIVTEASYHQMTTPVKLTSGRPMPYAFGLMPDTLGSHRVIAHGGGINGFISHLMDVPQDSLIVAVLANTSPAPSEPTANAIARVVLGLPPLQPPGPPKDLATTPAERAALVGSYDVTFPDGTKHLVHISDDSGSLMAQPDGQKGAKMLSQGGNVFAVPGLGRLTFDVANGHATGFVVGGGVRPLEGVRRTEP